MKTIVTFLFAVILFAACNPQPTDLLRDDRTRGIVYSEILRNHEYTKQLLDSILHSEHAMIMLQADTAILDQIVTHADSHIMMKKLAGRLEADSVSCKSLCKNMMKGEHTKATMMSAMKEGGMIDKDCMASKTKSAKDKPSQHAHVH